MSIETEQAIGYWRNRDKEDVVWFEAQTGLIRDAPPTVSNFYQYRVPRSVSALIADAVSKAGYGPSGLEYEPGFMVKVYKWEQLAK
jgi:hypothetical protein